MYFLSFSSNESVDILPPPCHFVQKASCSVIREPNAELISGSVGHAVSSCERTHSENTLSRMTAKYPRGSFGFGFKLVKYPLFSLLAKPIYHSAAA